MMFWGAIFLLAVWLLSVLGGYTFDGLTHIALLSGLMLLLIAFLRSREEAMRRAQPPREVR